jgi:hypothetical protein
MALFDVTSDELVGVLDEPAFDLLSTGTSTFDRQPSEDEDASTDTLLDDLSYERVFGDVASLDPDTTVGSLEYGRSSDDTASLDPDVLVSALEYGRSSDDVLSLDPDLIALAAEYQYTLGDAAVVVDTVTAGLTQESTSTDNMSTTDTVSAVTELGRVVSDSALLADSVAYAIDVALTLSDAVTVAEFLAAGLIKDVFPQDSVAASDETSTAAAYDRDPVLDVFTTSDETYSWVNGILSATLTGEADLTAILVKRRPPPAFTNAAPARTQVIPRTQPETIEHFVVNPAPPRRREDR